MFCLQLYTHASGQHHWILPPRSNSWEQDPQINRQSRLNGSEFQTISTVTSLALPSIFSHHLLCTAMPMYIVHITYGMQGVIVRTPDNISPPPHFHPPLTHTPPNLPVINPAPQPGPPTISSTPTMILSYYTNTPCLPTFSCFSTMIPCRTPGTKCTPKYGRRLWNRSARKS